MTAFVGPQRAGQDQPRRGDRLRRPALLAPGRRPTRRWSGSGADQAVVRAAVVRDGRTALLELEINPGRANRARVNRSPLPRAREVLGCCARCCSLPRTWRWSRATRPSGAASSTTCWCAAPRFAGVRADYDRVLKQRNSLLKTAGAARRRAAAPSARSAHARRLGLAPRPDRGRAARRPARAGRRPAPATSARPTTRSRRGRHARRRGRSTYKPSFELPPSHRRLDRRPRAELAEALLAEVERRRGDELDRGISLVGPHRDELRADARDRCR